MVGEYGIRWLLDVPNLAKSNALPAIGSSFVVFTAIYTPLTGVLRSTITNILWHQSDVHGVCQCVRLSVCHYRSGKVDLTI